MSSKVLAAIVALLIIAGGVGVVVALRGGEEKKDASMSKNDSPNGQMGKKSDQTSVGQSPSGEKRSVKRFTLVTVGEGGVKGDGSLTLKDKLTSGAIRLTEAPSLPSGSQYEVYVILKNGEQVFAGTLNTISNPHAKYLWGGGGQTTWFDANKFIVTRRANSSSRPGTVLAEGILPAQAEPLQ